MLPEDDANRQLAVGFKASGLLVLERQWQILNPANGWLRLKNSFHENHLANVEGNPNCTMILLIDFDENADRRELMEIPSRLRDQVFVLGCLSEPEILKERRSYEEIGRQLAQDCKNGSFAGIWSHQQLQHNRAEKERMAKIRALLFGQE